MSLYKPVCATNRRDMLDDAILSRFGGEMEIVLPGALERTRIFNQEMESVFPGAVIPEEIGSLTQGMSGRDLRHLASQVRTLAYPSAPSREQYLEAVKSSRKAHNTRVDSEARWETLVLDAGVLERLKLTCLLVRDAETWRAQGVTVPGIADRVSWTERVRSHPQHWPMRGDLRAHGGLDVAVMTSPIPGLMVVIRRCGLRSGPEGTLESTAEYALLTNFFTRNLGSRPDMAMERYEVHGLKVPGRIPLTASLVVMPRSGVQNAKQS